MMIKYIFVDVLGQSTNHKAQKEYSCAVRVLANMNVAGRAFCAKKNRRRFHIDSDGRWWPVRSNWLTDWLTEERLIVISFCCGCCWCWCAVVIVHRPAPFFFISFEINASVAVHAKLINFAWFAQLTFYVMDTYQPNACIFFYSFNTPSSLYT